MNVLISGASMAGLSAAYWFATLGHQVTVVERSDGLRPGGAPIDVRGLALGTAERMGILQLISEQKVALTGPMPVLDFKGKQVASLDLSWFANETDNDVEITRDRLNSILLKVIPSSVRFFYKETIVSINDQGNSVDVSLAGGHKQSYDFVVGADGLHSNVRKIVFGPEKEFVHHFGYYVALIDLPNERNWDRGMLTVPGLTITVRYTGDGCQAMLLVAREELKYDYRDRELQRQLIKEFLSPLNVWQIPELQKAFADPDSKGFYFDSVSQTHMHEWIKGNVAVIGDAGHCAALLSGMGTTLAMYSAEMLATTLTESNGNIEQASPIYHHKLRNYVEQCQAFAHEGAPIMVPPTQQALDKRNRTFIEFAEKFKQS